MRLLGFIITSVGISDYFIQKLLSIDESTLTAGETLSSRNTSVDHCSDPFVDPFVYYRDSLNMLLCVVRRVDKQDAMYFTNDDQLDHVPNEVDGDIYDEPRNPSFRSLSSADARSYTDVRDASIILPPFPFDDLAGHDTDIDNTAMEMTSRITDDELRFDSGFFSDVNPSSVTESPYFLLDSSTRELPPTPVVYEGLVKPLYANIALTTEMA